MNAALQIAPPAKTISRETGLLRRVQEAARRAYTHNFNGQSYVDEHGISDANRLFEKRYPRNTSWSDALDGAFWGDRTKTSQIYAMLQSGDDDTQLGRLFRELVEDSFVASCVNDSEGEP